VDEVDGSEEGLTAVVEVLGREEQLSRRLLCGRTDETLSLLTGYRYQAPPRPQGKPYGSQVRGPLPPPLGQGTSRIEGAREWEATRDPGGGGRAWS
jgi:hypothetical protein